MLHSTLKRLKGMDTNQIIIVTNDSHKFFVKSLVEETNSNAKLIIEPCGRNTAPAIAAAANIAEKDSMLLVLPADHLIESVDGFHENHLQILLNDLRVILIALSLFLQYWRLQQLLELYSFHRAR